MLLQKLLIAFILFNCTLKLTTSLELSLDSFFPKKTTKCYKCSTLSKNECRNDSLLNPLQTECAPNAKGCVKQVITTDTNKEIINRDCYYDNINQFWKNFDCGRLKTKEFKSMKCHKCKKSLCNSSTSLYISWGNWIYTMLLMGISYVLRT